MPRNNGTGLGGGEAASLSGDVPASSPSVSRALSGFGSAIRGGVTGLEDFVNGGIGQGIGNGLAQGINTVGNHVFPGLGTVASLGFRGIGAGLHALLTGFQHLIGAAPGYPAPGQSFLSDLGFGGNANSTGWRENAIGSSGFGNGGAFDGGSTGLSSGSTAPEIGQGPASGAPENLGGAHGVYDNSGDGPGSGLGGYSDPAPLPGTEDDDENNAKNKSG